MRALLTLALTLTLQWSCATLARDETVCDESRNLRCAGEPACSYDSTRGCRVCYCGPAGHAHPQDPQPVPGDPVPH